ncbi:hypothetical protein E1D47_08670, partial [Campylobacter coli]|nr:hypothetical protein [Campylobacter coli]
DNHPLNFKFKKGIQIRENYNLDNFISLSIGCNFFKLYQDKCYYFDEKLKPNFEDAKFINEYLLENVNLKSAFLPKAKYFYRKREDGSSSIDKSFTKDYFLLVSRLGVLSLLRKNKNFNIQYVVLYHFFWQLVNIINSPEKISILNEEEKKEYLKLLDDIFFYIDFEAIMKFSLTNYNFFHKVGILNCFKNKKPPFQIAYIEDYDPYKEQILITYYTGDDKDIESIVVDGEEVYPDYEKIVKYDFLDRVFCYQKRLWISIPKSSKDKLEIFINNKQVMIGWQIYTINIKDIRKEFQKRLPKSNIWLFADRDIEADDNAEHLYRYIMQNHPKQEIVFALRKESSDWERLEKEGFNLIEFGSYEFERIVDKFQFFISSHTPNDFNIKIKNWQRFVFLGHGVDAVNISSYFNQIGISLRTCVGEKDARSIYSNTYPYFLLKKEVVVTGIPRHDALLKNNNFNNKTLLIMPTWRKYLVRTGSLPFEKQIDENFLKSDYFIHWNAFINSNGLKEIVKKYHYKVIFVPHFNMRKIINFFNFPDYINISFKEDKVSFQRYFQNSDLMITDYTSAAFEMAYIGKPVIYYQFDKNYFFSNHSYKVGWFDYNRDGFGPVVYSMDELFKELQAILDNKCIMEEKYYKNILDTFLYRDCNNCARVFKAINRIREDISNSAEKISSLKERGKKMQLRKEWNFAYNIWIYLIKNYNLRDQDVIYSVLLCLKQIDEKKDILLLDQIMNFKECSLKFKIIYISILLRYDYCDKAIELLNNFDLCLPEKEIGFIKLVLYYYIGDYYKYKQIYSSILKYYDFNREELDGKLKFYIGNLHMQNRIEKIFDDLIGIIDMS